MSIVSVKDFGEALNISGGTIRSRISRGKLRCNKKGLIDTENPTNYAYILEVNGGDQSVFEKYQQGVNSRSKINKKSIHANKSLQNVAAASKKVVSSEKSDVESKSSKSDKANDSKEKMPPLQAVEPKKIPEKKVSEKLTAEEKRIMLEQKKANATLLSFEMRKKEAELLVIERRAELSQYELEKKAGNTLPLDLTTKIVVIIAQTILSKFLLEAENMVALAVEEFGGTRADTVRISNKLKTSFVKTVQIAETECNNKIELAVTQYSEVRSRGERK